jgi:hypothetical protein
MSQDPSVLYQVAFERNWNDEYKSLHSMRKQLQDQCDERIHAEHKKRQPRKRVHFDELPEGVAKAIVDDIKASPMYVELERLEAEVDQERKERDGYLDFASDKIKMEPNPNAMNWLKTSSSCSYGSQGYGAMKYAKGVLEPLLDMLLAHGFEAHIRQTNHHRGMGAFAIDHCEYELWANCPPWMFDAAHRCLSLADSIASLKRRCINPLVYNPFLPDECRL